MLEQFTFWLFESFNLLLLLIPVGVIGLWRWGVWGIRKIIGLRYRAQQTEDVDLTVSMVIPVYNEDREVFRTALNSWARERPDEIIAVVDHTDEACIQEFEAFSTEFSGARLIVTEKPGKRAALVDGIKAATSDIVTLVDSDTLWQEGVLPKLITPFKDPAVGGVGSRQNVLAPKTLAQRLFDIHLDSRYLDEIKFLAASGDAVTCLSGRTAVYRRSAVLPMLDDLLNETFRGKPCISGDDKRLTHLVQAAGWSVRYQENARVYTPGAPKMTSFMKQRLRWTRNSWRADLRAIYDGWVWRKPVLAFHLLDRIVQPLTTLIAPIYFLIALYQRNWGVLLILLAWWHLSRAFKILPHLRRKPSSILILPVYILTSYLFAIFKIFAFFTMNEQGWITRWDSARLGRVRRARLLPAYGATFSVVFFLGVGMSQVDAIHQRSLDERRSFVAETQLPNYAPVPAANQVFERPAAGAVGAVDVAQGVTAYELAPGDTPQLLAAKYGISEENILDPDGSWQPFDPIQMQLPFKDHEAYRAGLTVGDSPANISFLPEINTIFISGVGAVVDLPMIRESIDRNAIIEYEGDGVYFLKSSIFLESHTTLLLEAPDVSWLKLKSDSDGFAKIETIGGSVLVNGVRVTSWDPQENDYDMDYEDGRSYILIRNARMDVVDADMAYLGYSLDSVQGKGGVYGVSWRNTNQDRFGKELTTGYVENSKFHHNYFGVYTFGATGMIFRYNEFFNNVQYGFDPHDDSNNFIIEYNHAHDNGNHGIIISKRCVNNLLRWNRSENNELHGIMLDRQSNRNSVYGNILIGNRDGVALWDSHDNAIYDNEIIGNDRGVRLNRLSSGNVVWENRIEDTAQYGVYVYDEAHDNQVLFNEMSNNVVGIYLRALSTTIYDNRILDSEQAIYLTNEAVGNQILKNTLVQNTVAVYLKTRPDDFLANNTFEDNESNIQISLQWRIPMGSSQAMVSPSAG